MAKSKAKSGPADVNGSNLSSEAVAKPNRKRGEPENTQSENGSRKMPRRAAACSDFKEKSVRLSEKSSLVKTKRVVVVDDETAAIGLTFKQDDNDRPNRRLTDFAFHDEDGNLQPVEMLEVTDIYISGVILPSEETSGKEKEEGIRCNGFGRIETWTISGYEDGSPVIWVSTDVADYDCVKPANNYRKMHNMFSEKARACVEVYKRLSPTSGGNPDLTLDELLAGVARAMSDSKNFGNSMSVRDFIVSQGEFIYNQLIGLDDTSKKNEMTFWKLPVLSALQDESKKHRNSVHPGETISGMMSNGSLKIGDGAQTNSSACGTEEDEDMKMARLLQEEEYWKSMKGKKGRRGVSSSNKYYIKINEDEIADDYPLPAYYKTNIHETDEYVIFDNDMDISHVDDLPRSMLHNWSLYNCDSRLVSLELLPMKPCADIDVTIYGSGIMTDDDGSGFCLEDDSAQSLSSGIQRDGIPIYLSAVKEWMIEVGASMVFVSIRTDMAWYRLGKPSKQYAPWYETILRTARLAIGIITMLKEQSRVARLSFGDVIQKVSKYTKGNPAFISSNPVAVEQYIVVHGQILLQQFAEFPDDTIRKCPFVTGLQEKMEQRRHTKWTLKKKAVLSKGINMNPRAGMQPIASTRKAMPATTTKLINKIWGDYYSNYLPEDSKETVDCEAKENEENEDEQEQNDDDCEEVEEVGQEDKVVNEKHGSAIKQIKSRFSNEDISWDGEVVGKTLGGEALYKKAVAHGNKVAVGVVVLLEMTDPDELPAMYFIEYMYESNYSKKMVHGRSMMRGSHTVLGNAANEREIFLTNDCLDFELENVKGTVVNEIRVLLWGYEHRKPNALKDKLGNERAEERKTKGLPMEYFCKSMYCPERGAFLRLPLSDMGLGSGFCSSCKLKQTQREKETFNVDLPGKGFRLEGTEYQIHDYVYLAQQYFGTDGRVQGTFKSGRNVGLQAYVICQILEIEASTVCRQASPESVKVKVRRFFRPEDVSAEKAYSSDIREVYYSEQTNLVPIAAIEGKCEIRKKHDLLSCESTAIFEHIFFCEHLYDPDKGAVKQLPANVKFSLPKERLVDDIAYRKKKGKCIEGENGFNELERPKDSLHKNRLATLDIFAGCGGLSEGLEKAGVSLTKWAIEYEEPAGEAFKLNHQEALVFTRNCNVILRAIMSACGDEDDCISTSEATELASKLSEEEVNNLPRAGQVEFINGGPPCQGFSGMNRFNQSSWSKVQCEMILAFLSFADYFRPRFFLLENVRNFVSFNKGQTFRLTLASLLQMGYQVRFGILEAGAFGVPQSRKRAFIWAASPEETLPEWPEPMHVFASPELKISLSQNSQYAAVRSTANGAPFRALTVRDAIGDLPAVGNGKSMESMEYKFDPVSWFQKRIRGDMSVLTDHISKEMNELNLIRCKKIPKCPGADWRDLPDEKVKLSTGQMVDLIPWCLPNTARRHNQWKGLFGRLDWEGNFPTSITDPQPMGKVGMCFHPEQDRIVTVRECARSQGFPDSYKFAGNIIHRHRQIGNAVPPTLAFALGRKLKEALDVKHTA